MVDALASGASVRMDVEVRVLSWAPKNTHTWLILYRKTQFCQGAAFSTTVMAEGCASKAASRPPFRFDENHQGWNVTEIATVQNEYVFGDVSGPHCSLAKASSDADREASQALGHHFHDIAALNRADA